MNILFALIPALFWGLLPIVITKIGGNPIQQIIGTTLGTLLLAIVAYFIVNPAMNMTIFIFSFISGVFWTFGQMNQYKAFKLIGVSTAMPISTGMQLVTTSLMGVIFFGEWLKTEVKIIGFIAILLIVFGIYLTTKDENPAGATTNNMKAGMLTLLISTVGYLGYSTFPRIDNIAGWDAFLPQAIGMFSTSVFLSFFHKKESPWALRSMLNITGGIFFAVAALAYLISAQLNGIATGFTLSQMNVVIATLGSIFILGEKKTPKEFRFILSGLFLVVIGGGLISLASYL